jgi:hypothetical protein
LIYISEINQLFQFSDNNLRVQVYSVKPRFLLSEMGCLTSVEVKEERKRNDEIENQIRKDKGSMKSEVKMLLLGTINTLNSRYRRVWKIYHSKTNEINSHKWIYKGRKTILS